MAASPPDPPCTACSKPIESGSLVIYQHGELRHVRCRQNAVELKVLHSIDRARTAQARAERFVAESRRQRAARPRAAQGACPLCGYPATITDWRSTNGWVAVEDCPCNGFFVWAPLLTERVRTLAVRERQALAVRIRTVRRMSREAWLTAADGTVTGPLVVRTSRPDRPT